MFSYDRQTRELSYHWVRVGSLVNLVEVKVSVVYLSDGRSAAIARAAADT